MKYLLLSVCFLMFSQMNGQVVFQKDPKTGQLFYHKKHKWPQKTPAIGVMSSFERALQENKSFSGGVIDTWEVIDENTARLQTHFLVTINEHDSAWYKCDWQILLTSNPPVTATIVAQELQYRTTPSQPWVYCTNPPPKESIKNLDVLQLVFLNKLESFSKMLLYTAEVNDTWDDGGPPRRGNENVDYKPVIYLYPQQAQAVTVTLDYDGDVFVSYPPYNPKTGWQVQANPTGEIYCEGKPYSYLFWEGTPRQPLFMPAEGTVIHRKEAMSFLEYTTAQLGLTPKEGNEFIVFWLPRLLKHEFTHIYFSGADYTTRARLKVSPEPETVIRVFMMIQGVSGYKTLKSQVFSAPLRKGFVVVEWGGTELPAEEQ